MKPKLCPTLMNFRKGKQAATDSGGPDGYNEGRREKTFLLETSKGLAEGEKAGPLLPNFQGVPDQSLHSDISLRIGSWGLQGINVELEVKITFHLLPLMPMNVFH